MTTSRNDKRKQRAGRVRAKISGTATVPRLSVFKSLLHFNAQLIDDVSATTVAAAGTKALKVKNSVEGVESVAKEIVSQAKAKKIDTIVFDRAGYKYHGKVKAFADAVRAEGINF